MSRKRGKDLDDNEASLISSPKKRHRAIDDTQRVLVPRHELQDPFWSPVAQHLSDTLWCPINTHSKTGLLHSEHVIAEPLSRTPFRWYSHVTYQPSPLGVSHFSSSLPRSHWSHIPATSYSSNQEVIPQWQGGPLQRPSAKKWTMPVHRRVKARVMGRKKTITNTNEVTRSLGIRLYPNAPQTTLLRQWFGACRIVYNWVVKDYRFYENTSNDFLWVERLLTQDSLRQRCREWRQEKPWFNEVPNAILDDTLKQALQDRDMVINQNINRTDNTLHRMHYAKRKDLKQTITIQSQYCHTNLKFYPAFLHSPVIYEQIKQLRKAQKVHIAPHEQHRRPLHPFHAEKRKKNYNWPNLEGRAQQDCKLTYFRRLDQWKLAWVYTKPKIGVPEVMESDNQTLLSHPFPSRLISLDPGIRTFLTFYTPDSSYGKIGDGDMSRIVRLCQHMDEFQSRVDKESHRFKKWRMRWALARMRQKMQHLVEEIHKQTVHWLVTQYDTIILPHFDSLTFFNRQNRNLRSKTVRQMMTWSHAKFRQRLLFKVEEYKAECNKKIVVLPSEAYTSSTCTRCGWINPKLGGRKVFKCKNVEQGGCGLILDRDINGARNIMIRAFVECRV